MLIKVLVASAVLPCLLMGCAAIKSFNTPTKAKETPPQRIVGDAKVLRETGAAYISTGEYDKAISNLDKALQINPKYAEAYSNRADAYIRMGENAKAISDLNAAFKSIPGMLKPTATGRLPIFGKTSMTRESQTSITP